jgi:hypothetical protein
VARSLYETQALLLAKFLQQASQVEHLLNGVTSMPVYFQPLDPLGTVSQVDLLVNGSTWFRGVDSVGYRRIGGRAGGSGYCWDVGVFWSW